MKPLGNYIKITEPKRITNTFIIAGKEPLSKANVIDISPDISVPFKKKSEIFFHSGKYVIENKQYFLNIDLVVGYSKDAN